MKYAAFQITLGVIVVILGLLKMYSEYKTDAKQYIKASEPNITSYVPSLETVAFDIEKNFDSHAAYDKKGKYYTIVVDGIYMVKKKFKAGQTIGEPLSVLRIQEVGK